jgi:nucleoside-diphosphate-sugar epimerase
MKMADLYLGDYQKLNGVEVKKILITGSNGYIARNLAKNFSDYNLTLVNRSSLNLLDAKAVKVFFKYNYFDAVIHTATSGGSRLKTDFNDVFYENCLMHQNIMENSCSFNKYISFGSGAELDRRYDIDPSVDIKNAYPIDFYGMSKNFILKSGLLYPNFYNVRIFNVFNEDELPTRMIKANIINYLSKKPIVIHQDKWMDFFYISDLCEVVKFVINSNVSQKIINCSYQEKYKLSSIAQIINQLSDYQVEIIINDKSMGLNYYGDYNLHLFDIDLSELHLGIRNTYEKIREELK